MKIKIIVFLIVVLVSLVLLTGCVDVLHYIGEENNKLLVNIRWTLQKSVIELFAEMSGETITDDYYEKEFGLSEEEIVEEFPPRVEIKYEQINNQLDFGYDIFLSINKYLLKSIGENYKEAYFLPIKTEKGMRIILPPPMEAEAETEDIEMMAAFLASTKYRLIMSKTILPKIEDVFIKADEEAYAPSIKDLPEVYIIEFPLVLWILTKEELVINIY